MVDQQELDKAQTEFHTAVENAQTMLNNVGAALHDAIEGVFSKAKQVAAQAPAVPNDANSTPSALVDTGSTSESGQTASSVTAVSPNESDPQ